MPYMNKCKSNAKPQGKIGIIFIGVSVYLQFFERFHKSVENFFLPGKDKTYFVFTDNHLTVLPPNVRCIHVPFNDPRFIKLHKFHFISSILDEAVELDHLFYFDADSLVAATIEDKEMDEWFADDRTLVGVLHPWHHIRSGDKPFEQNPVSAGYVAPEEHALMDYHQSCFWGGTTEWVARMAHSVREMVDKDLAIHHTNRSNICDEIYVNRFFMSHRDKLRSLDTDYANPGAEYERATATATRQGHRFRAREVIVHDNAAQTRSWNRVDQSSSTFTHGAFAQFYKHDLAASHALECYRRHNPDAPVVLFSDAGDDLSVLANRFNCTYRHETVNIGHARSRLAGTDQYERLMRIRTACDLMAGVDWIVILEPDVECLRAPTAIPRYALCGPSRGPAWTEALQKMITDRHPNRARTHALGRGYTGCGGSILNREAFIECFDRTPREWFTLAAEADPRVKVAEDASMSFLFQINGYDTGGWEDFTGWRTEDKSPFAFSHGDKKYYGKPAPSA